MFAGIGCLNTVNQKDYLQILDQNPIILEKRKKYKTSTKPIRKVFLN